MVRKQKLDKELQDLKARTPIAAEVEPDTKKFIENNLLGYFPLKQKNVDTGMGVERTLAVLNNLNDNYQT